MNRKKENGCFSVAVGSYSIIITIISCIDRALVFYKQAQIRRFVALFHSFRLNVVEGVPAFNSYIR